jgi:hypothetical protein
VLLDVVSNQANVQRRGVQKGVDGGTTSTHVVLIATEAERQIRSTLHVQNDHRATVGDNQSLHCRFH